MSFDRAQVHPAGMDPVEYHTVTVPRGSREYPVSPSMLKEFARCPDRWVRGYQSPDSGAKDYGNLIDCLILTPDMLSERYVVRPETYETTGMECPNCKTVTDSKACRACKCERTPVTVTAEWSSQSKTCQAWLEAHKDREIISAGELDRAQKARDRLLADDVISAYLDASDRQVLVTGEWRDDETGITVPVRCLIDLVPRPDSEFAKSLGDLKSTRNGALRQFSRDVFTFGHHIQAAFDLDLYTAATGEDRVTWCLIVQESYPPFQPAKRIIGTQFLEAGRTQYFQALRRYCRCLASGRWDGYDDHPRTVQGWSVCEPEDWMLRQVMDELPPLVVPPEPEREPYEGEVVP